MLYDQFFIDDLKDRADLVRLIEPYAPLKKKGTSWMACCPFHEEKTPSFSVNPAKGFYKCFGCGKGGTAFNFLMEMEGLSFPEAVERVAELSGVPLPERVDDQQFRKTKQQREKKKEIADQVIELNKIALEFWESELRSKDKPAVAARKYLESRGISDEMIRQFRIGYAPDAWQSLHDKLKDSGADEELILKSGLVSVNEEKERVFDRFRGRIIFPVVDVEGRPVAFGARAMGEEQPKYLNSPETAAYVKGRHLYGLFQARDAIRRKGFGILVEGYLDLIALAQFGVTNVAASLGTAFTADQARLLGRFTKQVVINYDGDSAGLKAARRAIEELLGNGISPIKVLVLPKGADPDDFVREFGADAYNRARGASIPYLRFVLESASTGRNFADPKQKADAIEEALPVLGLIRNPIEKRESFDVAMDHFRVDSTLRGDLWRSVKSEAGVSERELRSQARRAASVKILPAERSLLEMLITDADLRAEVLPALEESDFEALATASIFRGLIELHRSGRPVDLASLAEFTADDDLAGELLPELTNAEPLRPVDEALDVSLRMAEGCVQTLRSIAVQNRIHEISLEALAAQQAGDEKAAIELATARIELERALRLLVSKPPAF